MSNKTPAVSVQADEVMIGQAEGDLSGKNILYYSKGNMAVKGQEPQRIEEEDCAKQETVGHLNDVQQTHNMLKRCVHMSEQKKSWESSFDFFLRTMMFSIKIKREG